MPGVPATTRLAGSAIVEPTPASAGLPAGLVSVKVSCDVPPVTIGEVPTATALVIGGVT